MTVSASVAMLKAAIWLDEHHPMENHSYTNSSDRLIMYHVNAHYPTGYEGFVEDLAQAQAVS